jgi:YVTN family beta-propeller protein
VYVTDTSGNRVAVIDARTNAVTATVPVGRGPQSVAVDVRTGFVFVLDAGDGTVTKLSPIHTVVVTIGIPGSAGPQRLTVDPVRNLVYVSDLFANVVWIISGRIDQVTDAIPVANPLGLGVSPRDGTLYVTSFLDDMLSQITR